MADRRRGAAHVYDVPGYKEPERIQRTEPSHSSAKITRVKTRDEAPGTYGRLMLVIAIAGIMLYAVIDSKVQATAVRNEINSQQKVVEMLRDENNRMQAEIESKSSRKAVESYAENILGMQKLDKSQCEYVSLESGNVIEIPEENDNIFADIKNAVSEFIDYLRG